MTSILAKQKLYLGLFGIWVLVGGILILSTRQGDLHLTFNHLNLLGNDRFFKFTNFLGDGAFAYSLAFLLCFVRLRWGIATFLACLMAGLTSQVLKQGVFGPTPRPVELFGDPTPLYLVPGVEMHHFYSFPSGHSAIAFALATSLALLTPWKSLRAALFFMAFLAAFSRVYLSQHFFEDVYVGSFVGLIAALIAHRLVVVRRPKETVPESTEKAETEPMR